MGFKDTKAPYAIREDGGLFSSTDGAIDDTESDVPQETGKNLAGMFRTGAHKDNSISAGISRQHPVNPVNPHNSGIGSSSPMSSPSQFATPFS